METFERFSTWLNDFVWGGIPMGDEEIPIIAIALLGVGVYLTLRLAFVQIRHFGHGAAVATGRYDDPDEPGDVSHFQALTTALSATVGIGNIAGVAIAIHWGGPGALFWMWVTAFLGMATKFAEVTLAQHYRHVEFEDRDPQRWEGSVAGGPMYYIERGLGPNWKWMAVLFAVLLGITAFFTGNAIQANTVSDSMLAEFGVNKQLTGIVTAAVVAAVILGGITRIGRVTSILAPLMAAVYVLGALYVILANIEQLVPSFALIFREAFNPSAGVAGTGVGAFLVTLMWGVRRGLFSNEAGQGSAPIAHAAAKTDEPVSEGVVALLEPFIDTIVICTMTAMVIIMTGVWHEPVPTVMPLTGDVSYRAPLEEGGFRSAEAPEQIVVREGRQITAGDDPLLAWHEVPVEEFFVDPEHTQPFTGVIHPERGVATAEDGTTYGTLYGMAVESSAPLTALGFQRGLPGNWGNYIVLMSVLLFAVSTAIAWSYYGDRCAYYLFGPKAVLPYKIVFVLMHYVGAVLPLTVIWDMGDTFLGIVIFPNLIALLLLSPVVAQLLKDYFHRKPWRENAEVHRRIVEERRGKRKDRS